MITLFFYHFMCINKIRGDNCPQKELSDNQKLAVAKKERDEKIKTRSVTHTHAL